MKILYHHRIASKDGQYVHVEELTKALKALGHEIIMVGPSSVEKDQFGSEGGFVSILKRYIPKFIYELMEFAYSFHAYRKLKRAVEKHKPDVMYERYNLYMPAGIWIKNKYKLPMLLEVNAPLFDERSKFGGIALPWLARWTEKYTWNNADHLLPVTQVLANRVMEEGVPSERVSVIPNGIDPDKFTNTLTTEAAKEKLGLSGKLVLGFTGFMREWHGLEKVLNLLVGDQNKDRFLLLVGDGPASDSIMKKANKLGVQSRLRITGIVQRENIVDFVSAFDIALQADVVDYASPLKLFEYMALGKAIVAPNKDNIKEILSDHVNALLFDTDSPDSFISCVEELCRDVVLRRRLQDEVLCLLSEKEYTWISNAEKVEGLFSTVTQNNILRNDRVSSI